MQLHLSLDPAPNVVRVRDRLQAAFGRVSIGRRRDPVSQLVRSILGSRTYDAVSEAVFTKLKTRFYPWAKLAAARDDEVLSVVAPVTYAEDKAPRLIAALCQARREIGSLELDFLASWPLEEAMAWLRTLPGVGQKVAASVLNFSTLRRRVFVVDGHVLRVAARLGLCAAGDDAGRCREAVMEAVPDHWEADDLAELHALMKRLGQNICVFAHPDCGGCPLRGLCPTSSAGAVKAANAGARSVTSDGTTRSADDAHRADLRRRIARLTGQDVSPEALSAAAVSLGRRELDGAFVDGALPPGLHQSAGARPEDGGSALILPIGVVLARPRPPAGARMLLVQEADARRECGDLHGPGMTALGLPPSDVVFVRVRDGPEALRVADEAVRCRAAPTVLLELHRGQRLADLSLTRRFNLAARRAGMFVFLVASDLSVASAASTRWRIASTLGGEPRKWLGPPTFHLDLVRNRQGRTGRWLVEWSAHDRRFRSARAVAREDERDDQPSVPAFVGATAFHRSRAA